MTEVLLDQDGHLQNHLDWSPAVAQHMATQEGLILQQHHLDILLAVREFYQRFGYAPATRPLIRFLIKEVGDQISNAQLMQDFNTGLVARTLARLSGLPKPANCL
ncbi:TusE/DsrC/DsvC family sulfur relay protein [Alkanindiges sp. WGS2144]|uniref:TusE/DsrC/DsvC family sulfur relay protein n=1 Tax=Alkanindiges sp. WGS2144 TaxID=3366808 RepID=UPI00375111E5